MSRALPTLAEIAQRLDADLPCDTLNRSLITELRAAGKYEAAAALEVAQRTLYECERVIQAAAETLHDAVDHSRDVTISRWAATILNGRPNP